VKTTKTVVTGVAALAAVAAIGACSNSATKEDTGAKETTTASASSSASVSAQAAPHNRADMMFAHMMIPHHEQAIEMSDIILSKQDIDPRVVDLAKQIKAAQGPEIEQMQGWLDQWNMKMEDMPGHGGMGDMPGHGGMGDMPGMGNMGSMGGMMSPAQMDALKNAQGVEATKLFLTGMIEHHEGAITMAQDEIKNGQFPDEIALAKSIVESQQKEIDTMKQILGSL
jgi:uncharacterized protein (DUF305 family)